MRNVKVVLSAVGLLLGGAALAESKVSDPDREFMEKAAAGGMAEVRTGRLAEQRAQSPVVKAFGRRMVEDHTRLDRQLGAIAAKKNVTLPSRMEPEDQQVYDRLSRLSGAEFDRVYIEAMKRDHDKDIPEFKKEESETQDPDLKTFAREALPVIEEHDRLARQDLSKLGAQPMQQEAPRPQR